MSTRSIHSTASNEDSKMYNPKESESTPARAVKPEGSFCDPVSLEIIRGAIAAAQSEMEALLERTAISAFIREKKIFTPRSSMATA